METGLSFFGTDEVNKLIRNGAKVASIEPGGVTMRKLGEDCGNVRMTLSGFSLKVRLHTSTVTEPDPI
jgi:hypothetical protein